MALLSVPSDPIPAWAKIDLQLHQPYRTFLGFGRLRCDWCGEPWGRYGCPSRESAARLFLYTARPAQRQAALDSGELTTTDLRLHRNTPNHAAYAAPATYAAHPTRPARHRRKPSPHPRDTSPETPRHRARDRSRNQARDRSRDRASYRSGSNPLTALRLELQEANR